MAGEDLKNAIEIDQYQTEPAVDYSVCTLVTDCEQYRQMLGSFTKAGFAIDETPTGSLLGIHPPACQQHLHRNVIRDALWQLD